MNKIGQTLNDSKEISTPVLSVESLMFYHCAITSQNLGLYSIAKIPALWLPSQLYTVDSTSGLQWTLLSRITQDSQLT